ncbi:hypothetical protein BDW42DRAFT_161266 [Aspergillus taichungensis]|uniref:GET complex, subunit GET2 n=1 Tax=Aspergillus taichungensis TaxID=482145 RepID=A0A2J5I5Z8_9EURO|nr:hypothetical protein BDW42DRAFT_161266 [Aspergillus taichungensis]
MSSPPVEESPAQRSARLRRERREAKIREGGAARLDKITNSSGRTPQSGTQETAPAPSPSPSPQPRTTISSPSPPPTQFPPAPVATDSHQNRPSPEDLRAQEEMLRALLRQPAPSPGPQGNTTSNNLPVNPFGAGAEDDPTMKLLSSLMGGLPGSMPGGEQPPNAPGSAGGPSPGDLASALGLPPFVSNMLGAATRQQTDAEKKQIWAWKVAHVIFAFAVGAYLLFVVGASIATFGSGPPPPATAQSPFLYFTTGEMVLSGARVMMKGRNGGAGGLALGVQLFRDVLRDGSIVVFLLGMGAWWHQEWVGA